MTVPTYQPVTDAEIAAGAPLRSSLLKRLRDNPLAILNVDSANIAAGPQPTIANLAIAYDALAGLTVTPGNTGSVAYDETMAQSTIAENISQNFHVRSLVSVAVANGNRRLVLSTTIGVPAASVGSGYQNYAASDFFAAAEGEEVAIDAYASKVKYQAGVLFITNNAPNNLVLRGARIFLSLHFMLGARGVSQ